jgi:hypothetical protein
VAAELTTTPTRIACNNDFEIFIAYSFNVNIQEDEGFWKKVCSVKKLICFLEKTRCAAKRCRVKHRQQFEIGAVAEEVETQHRILFISCPGLRKHICIK